VSLYFNFSATINEKHISSIFPILFCASALLTWVLADVAGMGAVLKVNPQLQIRTPEEAGNQVRFKTRSV